MSREDKDADPDIALQQKIAAFAELDRLDEDRSGDEFDERELEYRRRSWAFLANTPLNRCLKEAKEVRAPTPITSTSPGGKYVATTTPAGRRTCRDPAPARDGKVGDQDKSGRSAPPRSDQIPSRPEKEMSSRPSSTRGGGRGGRGGRGGKRKRGDREPLPDPRPGMVLYGLRFYYIPDNDISPARRMRITRARTHGAVWTRTILDATHVVVDADLRWPHIESIISAGRTERGPGAPPLPVVTENYPLDCIEYKVVLEADQFRYRIRGAPVPVEEQQKLIRLRQGQPEKQDQPAQNDPPDQNGPPDQNDPQDQKDHQQPEDRQQQQDKCHNGSAEIQPPPHGRSGPRQKQTTHSSASNPAVVPASEDEQTQSSDSDDDHDSPDRPISAPTRRDPEPEPATSSPPMPPPPPRPFPVSAATDELTSCIAMMLEYKDLPLDEEDGGDADSRSSTGDDQHATASTHLSGERDSGSDSERSEGERARKRLRVQRPPTTSKPRKVIASPDKFACHRGGTRKVSGLQNPNARTIEVLDRMLAYYTGVNDQWRTLAYRKAISTLHRQPTKITTEEEALGLPSVGPRLAAKIEEIVTTDRLRRLEQAESEPLTGVLETFLNVYGVGTAQASKWIAQGLRTLDDVRARAKLTPSQQLGIDRFHDLNTRIPRAEVEELSRIVTMAAAKIEPAVEMIIGGSYRRGAESCGDVDFIITRAGTSAAAELTFFLEALIDQLTADGVIVAMVASSLGKQRKEGVGWGGGGSKWHGCAVIPGTEGSQLGGPVWRRVDFLLVPETQRGAALLYFTGNDIFNRSMRLLASKKGMRLNQHGLYGNVMRGPGRVKINEGELLEGRDEKRIFEILGVQWREPWERWC